MRFLENWPIKNKGRVDPTTAATKKPETMGCDSHRKLYTLGLGTTNEKQKVRGFESLAALQFAQDPKHRWGITMGLPYATDL